MISWLLGLVPQLGAPLLFVATFLACLAVPAPISVLMLAAGGFASVGDLSLVSVFAAALAGAIAGDQLGYFLGAKRGPRILTWLGPRAAPIERASALLAARGGIAVFLSRWLVSALGPYVNLAAGMSRQRWAIFTAWGAFGELVWVGLYIGLGYAFTGNLEAASAAAANALGLIAACVVAAGLGAWLLYLARRGA